MFKILKNLFSNEPEDVLFAYRPGLQVGILDAQSIEKYLEKNKGKEVYVFTEREINENVKTYFSQLKNTHLIKCNNVKKEMKNRENKEKFQNKKIKKVSLDNFGSRPMSYDPS